MDIYKNDKYTYNQQHENIRVILYVIEGRTWLCSRTKHGFRKVDKKVGQAARALFKADVFHHLLVGTYRITILNGGKEFAMLRVRRLQPAQGTEGMTQVSPGARPQPQQFLAQVRIAGTPIQDIVKSMIDLAPRLDVVRIDNRLGSLVHTSQLVPFIIRHPLARQPGAHAFHFHQQFPKRQQLLHIHLGDNHPAARLAQQHALRFKLEQGFPNRCARHPKLAGQCGLIDYVPRQQGTCTDVVFNRCANTIAGFKAATRGISRDVRHEYDQCVNSVSAPGLHA